MPLHFTSDQFLRLGLELMGFKVGDNLRSRKNLDRFMAIFGPAPEALPPMFDDLQHDKRQPMGSA